MGATGESKAPHRELPDPKKLSEAGEVLIKDKDGKDVPFKSLYTDKPADERQLIVFIRHFFCGVSPAHLPELLKLGHHGGCTYTDHRPKQSCKQYVEALVKDLPPEKLSKANITLTIIGCGEHVCIEEYAKETGSTFPIYADPSVRTYKILGMMSTLRPGNTTPSYLYMSTLENFFTSLWKGLSASHPLSGGPKAQNGGEWLFQGGELKWCHRMRNATDHCETEELKKTLGVE